VPPVDHLVEVAAGLAGSGADLAADGLAGDQHLVAAVADHAVGEGLQGEQVERAAAVVDRLVRAWHQALAQTVEGPRIKGVVAVDDRGFQRQAHGAHLHLGLGSTGLGALQVHDRAVHIQVAAEQVHELRIRVDHPIALPVALVDGPKTDAGQLGLRREAQRATHEIAEGQAAQQLPLRKGLEHRQLFGAAGVFLRLDQGQAQGHTPGAWPQ
jgi:hypothetical protein